MTLPTRLRAPARSVLKKLWLASPLARPTLSAEVDLAVWSGRHRQWCECNPCAMAASRDAFYRDLWEIENLEAGRIAYLEFGSFAGESMHRAASLNTHPDSTLIGFDSFHGLPDAWRGLPRGHFSTRGRVPEIPDPRCRFIPGMFQASLPPFFAAYRPQARQVWLLDADLFTSTLYVLLTAGPFLRRDDIVIFDEFQSWMDEFRAFSAFVSVFPVEYSAVLRTRDWSQLALRIRANPYARDRPSAREVPQPR